MFYAVSSFNNAGFVPMADGLVPHVGDWWVCLPIALGVFIGSLGFPVIFNLARHGWSFRHLTLHSKLTITTSLALLGATTLLVGALEWWNPGTLGELPVHERVLSMIFAGVMPRSGGFSTIDVGQMHEASWLLTDAVMFVGGGSASTASGIKATTFAVLLLAILSEARGDRDVEAFGRRIPRETRQLEDSAKYVLAVLMFADRTGTITVAAALAPRDRRRVIRYPEERPIIG